MGSGTFAGVAGPLGIVAQGEIGTVAGGVVERPSPYWGLAAQCLEAAELRRIGDRKR